MRRLLFISSLLLLAGCTSSTKNTLPSQNPTTAYIPTDETRTNEIPTIEQQTVEPIELNPDIAGSYRCWQFNVDGYGGSCRTLSPIVLHEDGTYSISSTTGTYSIRDDIILLSESEYWGPGMIKESGLQIYFNYTYNSKQYEVTYLKE